VIPLFHILLGVALTIFAFATLLALGSRFHDPKKLADISRHHHEKRRL
jgi:hypothetical protein